MNEDNKDKDKELNSTEELSDNTINEEVEADIADNSEEEEENHSSTAPHLQSLGIAHSGSSTTNIPPRLPEGYSYNAPRATTPSQPATSSSKKKKQKEEEAHPDLSQPTEALRSEPSTFRHKKYRKKKASNTHWGRWIAIVVIVLLVVGAGVSYPWWSQFIPSSESEPSQPVVAADTLPVPVRTAPADTLPPAMPHEDSVHIQDSIRRAQWIYWQRRKKRMEEQKAEEAVQEVSTESSNNTQAVHADSLR